MLHFSRSLICIAYASYTVVCPSVRHLSVCVCMTLCIVALRVGIEVNSCTAVFLERHCLLISVFHTLFHQRLQPTKHNKPNSRNFRIWNSHGLRGRVTMAIPDVAFSARFGSVAIPYVIRHRPTTYLLTCTIGLLSALGVFYVIALYKSTFTYLLYLLRDSYVFVVVLLGTIVRLCQRQNKLQIL